MRQRKKVSVEFWRKVLNSHFKIGDKVRVIFPYSPLYLEEGEIIRIETDGEVWLYKVFFPNIKGVTCSYFLLEKELELIE